MSAAELTLVESFLSQRAPLEPEVRFRMADEVLRRIRPKLTLPADRTYSSEKWLEAVVRGADISEANPWTGKDSRSSSVAPLCR